MDLEPVYAEDQAPAPDAPGSGAVSITPAQQAMIGIRTVPVTASSGSRQIRVVGKIAVDETRVDRLSVLIDGVVRKVSAYTPGSMVQKDAVLATYMVQTRDLYNAALPDELLKAYRLSSSEIRDISQRREITRDIDFRAPRAGVVLERNVAPGAVVSKGTEVFRIADLSHVWVLADVFEEDAGSFVAGSPARVSYGAASHRGTVTAVRQFDPESRTMKVRLEMDNPGMTLRPDMFVNIEVDAKQRPGLTVPAESVLDNGRTKTVFVAAGPNVYEPRSVTTGPEYDGRIVILSGLKAGEQVVVDGTFLLDSESRLQISDSTRAAASEAKHLD